MRILITGADSQLGRAAIESLRETAEVRAVDRHFAARQLAGCDCRTGRLIAPAFVAEAMRGVDVILHLEPIAAGQGDDLADLEEATRGTYIVAGAGLEAGVRKIVLGSTLDLFDSLPADWYVNERWRPHPQPELAQLRAYLAELSTRQSIIGTSMAAVCLRFGRIVDLDAVDQEPYDPRWLALGDAVEGLRRAIACAVPGWSIYHITAAGNRAKIRLSEAADAAFGYTPRHDCLPAAGQDGTSTATARNAVPAQRKQVASRDIRRVVIFGAGGPMGAVAARELAGEYTLRLSDVRPVAEIAAEGPRTDQAVGAPLPELLPAPHEYIVADVTDPAAVMAACEGMDAVVNLAVVRWNPDLAFRINTLGVYNIARACIAHGIRRLVQTGPQLHTLEETNSYTYDFGIPDDAPPRPCRHLYGHSKYLGQELGRVYAQAYGLEMPVLLYNGLIALAAAQPPLENGYMLSWEDCARSIHRALAVESLPSPYEVFNFCADLPHGQIRIDKAFRLLGWKPQDDLSRLWQTSPAQ